MAQNEFATNGNDGMVMLQNTRWSIGTEWWLGYNDMHGYETETHIGRYLGKMQWIMPFTGSDWRKRKMEIGEITEMETKRYMGDKYLEKWVIKLTNYKEFNDVLIPTTFDVLWRLDKGDFSYAKFNVTEVEYNKPEKF